MGKMKGKEKEDGGRSEGDGGGKGRKVPEGGSLATFRFALIRLRPLGHHSLPAVLRTMHFSPL